MPEFSSSPNMVELYYVPWEWQPDTASWTNNKGEIWPIPGERPNLEVPAPGTFVLNPTYFNALPVGARFVFRHMHSNENVMYQIQHIKVSASTSESGYLVRAARVTQLAPKSA